MALSCVRTLLRLVAMLCVLLLLPAAACAADTRAPIAAPQSVSEAVEDQSRADDSAASADAFQAEELPEADLVHRAAPCVPHIQIRERRAMVDDRPVRSRAVPPETPPRRDVRDLREGATTAA